MIKRAAQSTASSFEFLNSNQSSLGSKRAVVVMAAADKSLFIHFLGIPLIWETKITYFIIHADQSISEEC